VALLKQRSTSQLPLGQTISARLPLESYRTLQTKMFDLTVKATKNSSVEHVVVMAVPRVDYLSCACVRCLR
jgi:hypothetical protein